MSKKPNNQAISNNNSSDLTYESKEELAKKFIRVGDEYMKEVFVPDKDGKLFRTYVKRDKGTVQDDLGKTSDAYKGIKKYEGFCLVPSHTNYQQVVQGFFNEYYQISHQPKAGEFESIMTVLKHIFNEKIEFILDYLQILYTKPTQRLPILLLESKERGTGKSTFGNLLKLMFEDNSAKLGNAELDSDFNSIWVKRLCIIVDETSLEKNSIMQMLKRFSTETGKVTANEKNKAQKQIDFFGKFIFLSNDEGKALPIEKGETRFAVFKVPTFEEKGLKEDPNIELQIAKEIPHFLNFLNGRQLKHSEESRMFFSLESYHTEQLQFYYDNSLSQTGKAIKELMIDSFNFFESESELCYSITNLYEELEGRFRYLDRSKIKRSLIEEFGLLEQKKNRYRYHSLKRAEKSIEGSYFADNENNYHFIFKKPMFIK
jgi:hypothetical protein